MGRRNVRTKPRSGVTPKQLGSNIARIACDRPLARMRLEERQGGRPPGAAAPIAWLNPELSYLMQPALNVSDESKSRHVVARSK